MASCYGDIAMRGCHWVSDKNGALTSQVGSCRLTVATIGGLPRFLVHREAPDAAGERVSLLASGTRPAVAEAMADAEAVGSRIAGLPRRQGRARP